MSTDDLEKRVNELEKKFAVATTITLLFAALIGASGVLYIPKKLKSLVDQSSQGKEAAEIHAKLLQVRFESDQVTKFSDNGTIKLGNKCFKPGSLVYCEANNDKGFHEYWTDACPSNTHQLFSASRFQFLAECSF